MSHGAGYIDARPLSRQIDENLLQRTAAPYIRVEAFEVKHYFTAFSTSFITVSLFECAGRPARSRW
jgi:hypothetical protein